MQEESGVRGEEVESSLSAASVTGACARGLAEAEA